MVARFLDGLPHGAYFGVASLVAASMAPAGRQGRAVAMVMLGLSVANVIGVPAATWLGQSLGWRAAYWAVAGLALLTVALVMAFVPGLPGRPGGDRTPRAARRSRKPQVWLTLLAGAIGFGGMFAVYSYIAPTVTEVGGLPESAVPVFLLAFGLGMVAGTWLAGAAGGLVDPPHRCSCSSIGIGVVLLVVRRAGAVRLVGDRPRVPDHRDRLGAGREPPAAADGRRRRRADPRRGDEPRLAQHRQRARRLARRPRHRRRATATGRTAVVGAALSVAGFLVVVASAAVHVRSVEPSSSPAVAESRWNPGAPVSGHRGS